MMMRGVGLGPGCYSYSVTVLEVATLPSRSENHFVLRHVDLARIRISYSMLNTITRGIRLIGTGKAFIVE